MESFAFWCSKREGSTDRYGIDVVANFNLWMPNRSNDAPALDVGFKISHPSQKVRESERNPQDAPISICELIESISFYCPFKVDLEDFEDLSKIMKDIDVTSAIFNENCTVETTRDYRYDIIKTQHDGKDDNFYLCSFESEALSFTPRNEGTEIHFSLNQENKDDKPIYMRFRIKSQGLKGIATPSKARDRLLTSAFTKEGVIDFRFNDYRTMNRSLWRTADGTKDSHVDLSGMQVHFLLMTKANVNVKHWSDLKEVRPLEKNIWKSYLPNGSSQSNVKTSTESTEVAWHWKSKKGATDDGYKLYLLLQTNVSNWKTILMYLAILLLITIVFDGISEWVRSFIVGILCN